MLPEIVFDTEEYDEIYDEIRSKIASIYPEWTDYNYHDPGITMLELFAWLKEGQQFYLDQTGEEQKEKFLKLLGTRRLVKEPAKAMIYIDVEEDVILPKGTKFYADTICYESVEENYLLKEGITKCFYGREDMKAYIDRAQLDFGYQLKFFMFGEEPASGDMFFMGFPSSLPIEQDISINLEFFSDYEVKRNPLKDKLKVPFTQFVVEYLTENGWHPVKHLRDDTYGFLQSGALHFHIAKPMAKKRVYQENGYFLRIRLISGIYDLSPMLTGFGTNGVMVEQLNREVECCENCEVMKYEGDEITVKSETFLSLYGENDIYLRYQDGWYEVPVIQKYLDGANASCTFCFLKPKEVETFDQVRFINFIPGSKKKKVLGVGNGYPNQSYDLYDEFIEYDSFEILVQRDEEASAYIQWEKVTDFAQSGPEDRHYVLDTRNGIVKFGNCIHGLAPEGEIRIAQYVQTLGSNGKVKANKMNRIAREIPIHVNVTNPKDSVGGRKEESYEESFIRVQRELKQPATAVTYEDYERYIKETPGLMIASCKALTPREVKEIFPYYDESAITIVVKPFAKLIGKSLMQIYKKNIIAYLETYRMTGTSVYLIRPEYIHFSIYVEVVVKAHYIHGKEEIKETVETYFKSLASGFGETVVYSRLYGVIDMLSCVKQMRGLSIEVRGTGVKHLPDGSIEVPPNGVVELEHAEYQYTVS